MSYPNGLRKEATGFFSASWSSSGSGVGAKSILVCIDPIQQILWGIRSFLLDEHGVNNRIHIAEPDGEDEGSWIETRTPHKKDPPIRLAKVLSQKSVYIVATVDDGKIPAALVAHLSRHAANSPSHRLGVRGSRRASASSRGAGGAHRQARSDTTGDSLFGDSAQARTRCRQRRI